MQHVTSIFEHFRVENAEKINKIFIFNMFTNHSKNYQSELQHKHFLPTHTQFNSNNN